MSQSWTFNTGRQGWAYEDDHFDMTDNPAYAGSFWNKWGRVAVKLGGKDNADVDGMSGALTKRFTLEEAGDATIKVRYRVDQSPDFEADEYAELRVAIDGAEVPLGSGPDVRVTGDGEGGPKTSTGWKTLTLTLDDLEAGTHEIALGGYLNAKTTKSEVAKIFFDEVTLKTQEPAASPPPPPPQPEPDPVPGPADLDPFEAEVFRLTNEFRARNGLDPYENDARLNAAAEDWSRSMGEDDFFAHSTPAQVEEQGYAWRAWGENIAAGQSTPAQVVAGWIASPGHRKNMLATKFEDIGIGYFEDSGPGYTHYWTQVFGAELA